MTRARTAVLATGLLGWLVAFGGVQSTGEYTPVWLESEAPCELAGACSPAEIDAALQWSWWWVGAGLGILAVAAVLLAWTLPPRRSTPSTQPPLPAPVHALVAGLLAFGGAFVAGIPLLFASFGGAHGLAVGLTSVWLAQAGLVLAAGRLSRTALAPGAEWLTALVVSGLGVGAVIAAYEASADGSLTPLPVVDAVMVAVAVLGQRSLLRLGRPPVWSSVAAGLAVLTAGLLVVGALLLPEDRPVPTASPVPQAEPLPVPTPTPTPRPTPPAAVPTPTPTPEPVEADVPCAQQDLTFRVEGFDAAMGARGAGLVATNTGAGPCWVEGVPVVVLLQGGRPLALQVEEGQAPEGGDPEAQRVGIAPGGTAVSVLTWRSYGGWADQETPQAVTVALDASTTLVSAQVAGSGAAPFDIADGGAWNIAPWAAPAT
ncbi:DUF4232 domain-containing protein [Modestobacter sp. SSW1-42]|uniref:DUF4232 domain-containing protein n=1 Tax=Modestobacter sp. SSW1-42 TaxID=596372 RepID=UPI0039872EE5